MKHKIKNIIAIFIGILPINIMIIWYRLSYTEGFSTYEMLTYPLIFGGGNILLILSLNKYLLGESFEKFNQGRGKWYWDILLGFILSIIYFLLLYIEKTLFAMLLPKSEPPSQEVINLMIDLANNPLLLLIWIGPVVWIGVALFEEMTRVFFLNCLWTLSQKKSWEIFAILFVSIITGIIHMYQGTFGIISVTMQSFIMAIYYYKFRRIWPLIISHAIYDSVQIMMFVLQVT